MSVRTGQLRGMAVRGAQFAPAFLPHREICRYFHWGIELGKQLVRSYLAREQKERRGRLRPGWGLSGGPTNLSRCWRKKKFRSHLVYPRSPQTLPVRHHWQTTKNVEPEGPTHRRIGNGRRWGWVPSLGYFRQAPFGPRKDTLHER